MPFMLLRRVPSFKPFFFYFSLLAFVWVVCLLSAGGITTSIHAGMAFLDWPLSNGSLNPDGWLGQPDQLAEHSHRLLGMKVGFLSLIIFVWAFLRESRPFVRYLAGAIVVCVIFQGLLGGARVLLDPLNGVSSPWVARLFAVAHACGAQAILAIWVSLILSQSRFWIESSLSSESSRVRFWGFIACGGLFIQLLIGALMRHMDAGLAIPSFPKTPDGTWLPTIWSVPVAVHFAHRVIAVGVTCLLAWFLYVASREKALMGRQAIWGLGITILVFMQILLGVLIILTFKNPYVATCHVLTGAFLLACTWGLTFCNCRRLFV